MIPCLYKIQNGILKPLDEESAPMLHNDICKMHHAPSQHTSTTTIFSNKTPTTVHWEKPHHSHNISCFFRHTFTYFPPWLPIKWNLLAICLFLLWYRDVLQLYTTKKWGNESPYHLGKICFDWNPRRLTAVG